MRPRRASYLLHQLWLNVIGNPSSFLDVETQVDLSVGGIDVLASGSAASAVSNVQLFYGYKAAEFRSRIFGHLCTVTKNVKYKF